jgi:hypothetical protein
LDTTVGHQKPALCWLAERLEVNHHIQEVAWCLVISPKVAREGVLHTQLHYWIPPKGSGGHTSVVRLLEK